MYRIIAYESPTATTGHIIYDPKFSYNVLSGKLSLIENEVDNMTLTIGPDNWLYGKNDTFNVHVEVYQDNSTLLFRGRLLDVTREMTTSGVFKQTFVFESVMNYLQDSIQRYKKVQNTTPRQFLQNLIDFHNSQVPDYKKFTLRTVTVTNSTDNVYRYVDYVSTWNTIKDKLLSRLGGVIRTQYKDGVNYIDYITSDQGKLHENDTQIIIGRNMKSLSVKEDPTAVITRLVPLGATIENDSPNQDTGASNPRVTIADVNDGKDYIDIPVLQNKYGIINGTNTWDDVHEPSILLSKANSWISSQTSSKESYTLSALELPNYDYFVVSDSYQVINERVMTKQMLRVIQKDIDFNEPLNSSLTVGSRTSSLSSYQLETINAQKQAKAMQERLNASRSDLITLTKDYSDMANQFTDLQKQIADMNGGWRAGSLFVTLDGTHGTKDANWYSNLANNNIDGAIINLTTGSSTLNSSFNTEKSNIVTAGITLIGVYHTLQAANATDAATEGNHFLSQLQAENISTSAIVACSITDDALSTDKTILNSVLSAFYRVLTDAGYNKTTDYSDNSWFGSRFDSKAAYKWIINTNTSNAPSSANAWQYNNNFNSESLSVSKSYDKAFI